MGSSLALMPATQLSVNEFAASPSSRISLAILNSAVAALMAPQRNVRSWG
jgi:hypothetical protein